MDCEERCGLNGHLNSQYFHGNLPDSDTLGRLFRDCRVTLLLLLLLLKTLASSRPFLTNRPGSSPASAVLSLCSPGL